MDIDLISWVTASVVVTIVFLFVKELRKITKNDETIDVNFNEIYLKACKKTGSPSGIGAFSPEDVTLRNRVYQELLGKEFVKEITNDNIGITYKEKSAPGFG